MERPEELIEDQSAEAGADMLSPLEDLVGEWGFLSLTRAQAAGLAEDALVALRAGWTKPVAKHATVADWSERDDVRRDIR